MDELFKKNSSSKPFELDFSNQPLTQAEVETLCKNIPQIKLKHICLANTALNSADIVKVIQALQHTPTTGLDISGCTISDDTITKIVPLLANTNLHQLSFDDNNVSQSAKLTLVQLLNQNKQSAQQAPFAQTTTESFRFFAAKSYSNNNPLLPLEPAAIELAKTMLTKVDAIIEQVNEQKSKSGAIISDLEFMLFCANLFKKFYHATDLSRGSYKFSQPIASLYDFRQLVIDFLSATEMNLPLMFKPSLAASQLSFSLNPFKKLIDNLKAPLLALEPYNGRSKSGLFLIINPTSFIFATTYLALAQCLLQKKGLELASYSAVSYFCKSYLNNIDEYITKNIEFYLRFNYVSRLLKQGQSNHSLIEHELTKLRNMLLLSEEKMFKHSLNEASELLKKENKDPKLIERYKSYIEYYSNMLTVIESYIIQTQKSQVDSELTEKITLLTIHAEQEHTEIQALLNQVQQVLKTSHEVPPNVKDLIEIAQSNLQTNIYPLLAQLEINAHPMTQPTKHCANS